MQPPTLAVMLFGRTGVTESAFSTGNVQQSVIMHWTAVKMPSDSWASK